jgi:hypothetical protein
LHGFSDSRYVPDRFSDVSIGEENFATFREQEEDDSYDEHHAPTVAYFMEDEARK